MNRLTVQRAVNWFYLLMRNELLGIILLALLALSTGSGCASMNAAGSSSNQTDYFAQARTNDGWNEKIQEWQSRSTITPAAQIETSENTDSEFSGFRSERRRQMARNLVTWTQRQSQQHFTNDDAADHWATLEETLRRGQEDCDGLELLIYNGLQELGFAPSSVYRAVVYRTSDLQHHMVTLWFEDPQDPWVLDPTGAMTNTMVKMSDVPNWMALKVFSQTNQYSVQHAL